MTIKAILSELQELQSGGDVIYPKGVFPSQRYHPFLPYKREDDNLFFTSSIVRILQTLLDNLNTDERPIADAIIKSAFTAYPLFKNKDGLDTYNFWQTDPSRHFPNGLFMNKFKHFQIPDDVDDTALVYLTEGADSDRVKWLKDKLKLHSNLVYQRAFNPLPKYQDLKCYSTFFGKKMYIEFDVCVLSNLMSLILSKSNSELNEYDRDTLEFICAVVEGNEHISHPFYSAPNYPTSELILYHLARLIPTLPKEYSVRISDLIKRDIQQLIKTSTGMNKILLANSALKLDISISDSDPDPETALEDSEFFFFHAGMITAFENSLAQSFANRPFFHLRYTSKALNRALLIENLVLKRAVISR